MITPTTLRRLAGPRAGPEADTTVKRHVRPRRFAITGATAGATQLALLAVLTHYGWAGLTANVAAFLVAAQINFALSSRFTWRDRREGRGLRRRWLTFHVSILGMACLNMLVFAIARPYLPDLLASAAGILAAASGNYLIGDRLVFRAAPPHDDRAGEGPGAYTNTAGDVAHPPAITGGERMGIPGNPSAGDAGSGDRAAYN